MSKVLSVLVSINVQAKSDINLGGQGMVITKQGVAIQPCFHASKTHAIYKTGLWVVFIKTRTETCIKGWIELAVFKAFWDVLSFGLGSRNWSSFSCSQYGSPTGSPSITPWSTTHTNSHTIKTQKIKVCRRARFGNT